ncbi:transposable element Tcb2 transposase [Trichonephila clavipes]|nr:transposable element Tcb2 transposase [Trichonephila clavipes]
MKINDICLFWITFFGITFPGFFASESDTLPGHLIDGDIMIEEDYDPWDRLYGPLVDMRLKRWPERIIPFDINETVYIFRIASMDKLPDLDAFDREQIVGARRMDHSVSKIVTQLEFSRPTVSRVYQEYMYGGQKAIDHANYKEQLDLTVRGEKRLRRIVCSQRSQTLALITTKLNDGASRTVSKETVQRSLHRTGFGSRRPTRVPLLNACYRAAHPAWAREHRDWSVEDWKRVAWGGEFRFRLLNVDGRLEIWRQVHKAMDPARLVGTVQGYDGSIMQGNVVFRQDNCTSDKSQLGTGWLDEFSSDFSVINWPPRSLDLNAIEHLWVVLEQGVKGRHTAPKNFTELWTALANIWQVIPMEPF